jgi:hypothetical protein
VGVTLVDSATPQWEFAEIPRTGEVRAAGPIVLQLRDNPAAFVSHISDRFMTQHCDLPFCALNPKSHINHGEADIVPEPLVMLGGIVRRKTVMLVNG